MRTLFVIKCVVLVLVVLFPITASAGDWWDTDWDRRKKLTFDNSGQGALSDFPVLVKLTSSNFDFSLARSGGEDIRFVDYDDTTELKYEIERWDAAGQKAEIWVKVPNITGGLSADFIYVYYNNPGASDNQDSPNVWDDNFKMVQHLGEEHALDFNGTDDCLEIPTFGNDVLNTFTIDFWARPDAAHEIDMECTSGVAGTTGHRYAIQPNIIYGNPNSGAGVSVGTNGVSVYEHSGSYMPALLVYETPISGWTHIVVVYTNKQPKLYINGDFVKTGLASPKTNVFLNPVYIGYMHYGSFDGLLDDVRFYTRALDPSEITDSYHGKPVSTTGLYAEYLMNEGSGLAVADSSGNNRHGDMTDHAADWARPRAHDSSGTGNIGARQGSMGAAVEGQIALADAFEGNYIDCGHDSSLDITSQITLEAWVNPSAAGWKCKRLISITGSTYVLTDYQVKIAVDYDSDMKSDFSDLRFCDSNGDSLSYWVEDNTASMIADVWVKVPLIPTSGTTIYMYYGNPTAASASNGTNTFEFFDDFEEVAAVNYFSGGCIRATAYVDANKIIRYDNKTHITYLKYDSGSHKVYIRTYHHDTDTWDDEVYVATVYDDHGGPCIAVNSTGYLHIMYDGHAGGIKHRKSTNSNDAGSWGSAVQVATNWATYPAAVIDSNDKIHMVYADTNAENHRRMHYIRYEDGTWSNDTILAAEVGYRVSYSDSIAIDSNDVLHVGVFFYRYPGNGDEKAGYMKSTDGGSTWKKSDDTSYSLPIAFSTLETIETGYDLRSGNIAVDSGNHPMIVVQRKHNSPGDMQFWRFNGSSWDGTVISVSGKNIGQYAALGFYNDVIYIFAPVYDTGQGWGHKSGEIYIFYSTNNGSSFNQKQISTTDASNANWTPNVEKNNSANSLSEMRLLWMNGNSNPTKVYFAKIDGNYDAEFYGFGNEGVLDTDKWTKDETYGSVASSSGTVTITSKTNGKNVWITTVNDVVDAGTAIRFKRVSGTCNDYYGYNGFARDNPPWVATYWEQYSFDFNSFNTHAFHTNEGNTGFGSCPSQPVTAEIRYTSASSCQFYSSDTSNSNTPNSNIPFPSKCCMFARSGLDTANIKLDWILIREYASPEPAVTMGNRTAAGISKAGAYGIGADTTTAFASINDQSIEGAISSGWNHIVLTYNKDAGGPAEMKLFINGAQNTTADYSTAISTNVKNLLMGDLFAFSGNVDEVRVSNTARSADWIKATHMTQGQDGFPSCGEEELCGGGCGCAIGADEKLDWHTGAGWLIPALLFMIIFLLLRPTNKQI